MPLPTALARILMLEDIFCFHEFYQAGIDIMKNWILNTHSSRLQKGRTQLKNNKSTIWLKKLGDTTPWWHPHHPRPYRLNRNLLPDKKKNEAKFWAQRRLTRYRYIWFYIFKIFANKRVIARWFDVAVFIWCFFTIGMVL